MKIITCDLCKKDMGRNVGIYTFIVPQFSPSDFFMGEYTKKDSDICTDCWNKIAEAQKKSIEEITNPKE